MTECTVRRWARFGHERLYADSAAGIALGYLDVKTGAYHAADPLTLSSLREAIDAHLASRNAPASPNTGHPFVVSTPPPDSAQVPNAPLPWVDLSMTQAGAAAREQAIAAREEQGTVRHLLARVTGARTDERAWRIGANGEQAVAAQLTKLGPAWRILHAIPVGGRGADIDHLAIGPGGVFTINAKHHPDATIWVGGNTFMVNGRRVPYLRNSRHEAHRASRLLSEQTGFWVPVAGVIAVMGARKGYTVRAQPEDGAVVVVRHKRVRQHLESRPVWLNAQAVEAIFEVARRSTTWAKGPKGGGSAGVVVPLLRRHGSPQRSETDEASRPRDEARGNGVQAALLVSLAAPKLNRRGRSTGRLVPFRRLGCN